MYDSYTSTVGQYRTYPLGFMYDSYTSTVGQYRTYPLGFTHNV